MTELTGDDAPCSDLCYCERAGLIAEVARMREAKRMAGLIADERSRENVVLRAALEEIIRIKDDTLGERGDETPPPVGREHFDRGCRMAFYRCAAIARAALEQSAPTPPSFNNVGDMLAYLNDDDKQKGTI